MPQQAVLRKPFGLKFNVDEQMGIECSDLHLKMKLDERRHRAYCPEARYLRFRRLLVDWMCEVGDELPGARGEAASRRRRRARAGRRAA